MSRLLPTELCQMITSFAKTEYEELRIMIGEDHLLEIHGNIENEYAVVYSGWTLSKEGTTYVEKVHKSVLPMYITYFMFQRHKDNMADEGEFMYSIQVGLAEVSVLINTSYGEQSKEEMNTFFREAGNIISLFGKILK